MDLAEKQMREHNDRVNEAQGWLVNTNESLDWWHRRGQHGNGAITVCALCVAEGNTRGLSAEQIAERDAILTDEEFEAIIDLEREVVGAKASLTCAPLGLPDYLWAGRKKAYDEAERRLGSAIDGLSLDRLRDYGLYRARVKAALAAQSA